MDVEDEEEVQVGRRRVRGALDIRIGRRFWKHTFCTLSYLCFEIISFVALLSISIGLSVLAAISYEYGFEKKMSTFLQTYVTLYFMVNLGYMMARHHMVHIYPLRHRFGNQADCCASCKYPWNISVVVLILAYMNLFYQFSRLLCVSEQFTFGIQWRRVRHSTSESTRWRSREADIGQTTALFLLSLNLIQYLTARKLRWDFYKEFNRMQEVPRFPSCIAYVYAVLLLTGIQMILSILYSAPILLWLLLSRVFAWSVSTTVITVSLLSMTLGSMAAYVERQEPIPNVNHSRLYQIVNLRIRPYVLCLVFIPFTSYWFYYEQETACNLTTGADGDLSTFNLFIINVCLCILNTTKFSKLSSHSRHRREPNAEDVQDQMFLDNQIAPENELINVQIIGPPANVEENIVNVNVEAPVADASANIDVLNKPQVNHGRSLSKLKYLWALRTTLAKAALQGSKVKGRIENDGAMDSIDLNLNVLPMEFQVTGLHSVLSVTNASLNGQQEYSNENSAMPSPSSAVREETEGNDSCAENECENLYTVTVVNQNVGELDRSNETVKGSSTLYGVKPEMPLVKVNEHFNSRSDSIEQGSNELEKVRETSIHNDSNNVGECSNKS